MYGDLRHYNRNPRTEKWTIHDPQTGIETDIDPNTVGQYTGLKDINGKEIYEGDIVAAGLSISLKDRPYGFIKWHPKGYFYIHTSTIDEYQDCIPMGELAKSYPLRVLGNIFDNPEMMKGGEK